MSDPWSSAPSCVSSLVQLCAQNCDHLPPPPPNPNGEAIRVWCPLGPLVYAGCSAAASAASTGGTQGREALFAP